MTIFSEVRSIIGTAVLAIGLLLISSAISWAVSPLDFGAKADVVTLRDGSISEGTATFSSNSARFTAADTGKAIVVTGGSGYNLALVTRIVGVVSRSQVTLADSAGASVTGSLAYYGTDDTDAIRKCVYEGTARGGECTITDGRTFLISNRKSTIAPLAAGHNPIEKGVINGHGRIIFAPQGELTGGVNDRLFYISSHEEHPCQIAEAISKGSDSFVAASREDAATLKPGDWVIITERDSASVAADNLFADWMQISNVDGAVVHTTRPFRMAFPNRRPWSGPPGYWGLSFRKVGPITSNITIRDLTIIVPPIVRIPPPNHRALVGIDTRDTRGTVISGVNCQDEAGNCFAGLLDQGLTFQGNKIQGAIYSEFASMVDTTIADNEINLRNGDFNYPTEPTSGGLEVDFGTGFSRIVGNRIGPTKQVCIQVSIGVHDTVVERNSCDRVTFGSGANCILSRGGYRMTVTGNTCEGGTGRSTGISFGDANGLTSSIYTEGNRVYGNTVKNFARPYDCSGGRLRTDQCQPGR